MNHLPRPAKKTFFLHSRESGDAEHTNTRKTATWYDLAISSHNLGKSRAKRKEVPVRIDSRDFAIPALRQHARRLSLLGDQGDSLFVEGDEGVSAKPGALISDHAIGEVAPGC